MASSKIRRKEKFKLKGSLKKNGFDRWRLVTNGISTISGEEKTFLIEFYAVNPSVSPKDCVLGFKNRFDKSTEDFQYVLAGSDSAKNFQSQTFVIPSFLLFRAGVLSRGGVHVNSYFPCENLFSKSKEKILSAEGTGGTNFVLTDDHTEGSVKVTKVDLTEHPEFLGGAGSFSWDLRFDKSIFFEPDYHSKNVCWAVLGGKTNCSGKIIFNGEEYSVSFKKSFGYYDKNWGRDFATPYFHLSSCNLTSAISGCLLENSAFAVQGEFREKLSVLLSLDGKNIEFHADKFKKYSVSYDCQEINGNEDDGLSLHWTVSAHDRKYVLDIDVYCATKEMTLRDFESPGGGRKLMKVLAGGNGNGRLKLYKKMKKSLELIEQADIAKCLCEYGNLETAEK
jgi:hypothetical protein